MSEVLQANIFFFITAVAVVVVTLLVAAVLVYVLMIVRNVKDITDRLKEGSEIIAGDLQALRGKIFAAGNKVGDMGTFLVNTLLRRKSSSRRKKNVSEEANEV